MWKLRRVIRWLLDHLYIKTKNLNDDAEGPAKPAVEIGIKGTF